MPTKGKTLRIQRVRAGFTQTALAAQMGRHRNTLVLWEKLAEVKPEDAAEYLAALEALTAEKHGEAGSAA